MKTEKPEQAGKFNTGAQYPPEFYEIKVQGQLDSLWGQWFEGMALSNVENGESGVACTLISGYVVDQAELHGLLIKIRDLNLKLISVRRISPDKKNSQEVQIDLGQD
jgi:hypothetical protein